MKQKWFHDLNAACVDVTYIRNTVLRDQINFPIGKSFVMRSGDYFESSIRLFGVVQMDSDGHGTF